ncbi:MAG: GAF domain-containing protein [Acidobacteriota bacterium]
MSSSPWVARMNALLSTADSSVRARLIAVAMVEIAADCACLVHRLMEGRSGPTLAPVGLAGPVSLGQETLPATNPLVAAFFAGRVEPMVYVGSEIPREEYAHVLVTRTITSLVYLPILHAGKLAGVMEVLCFGVPLRATEMEAFQEMAGIAGTAIVAAEEIERQQQNLLDSIHRMSQLYDLEKSLNATLELDEVIAMAPAKTAAMLPCQAMHLWLFDGEDLRLMAIDGEDATVSHGMVQRPEEGLVAAMAEEGEPLLIADPADERLLRRNEVLASLPEEQRTPPVSNLLLVPLMQDGSEIGVLEAVNRRGEAPFDEDDEFFLTEMAETASHALKNAGLMHAERKLEILETLVHVSSEITSTLRLDRLLQIIVNSPQTVLPYEMCAIALENKGALQLRAVSGMANIPMGDAQVDRLQDLLRVLNTQSSPLHVRRMAGVDQEMEAGVAKYFEGSGYHGLYALPLEDDQGRVGMLLYAAGDPEFLDAPQIEMIKILGGQATVAIRNALLYREVPLIGLLEPLLASKRALLRTSRKRRLVYAAATAASGLFLVFCPLPMRVAGEAVVEPQHLVTVAAPADGNVQSVLAHEGERVAAGALLGTMNDWQWRADLAAAQARYQRAELTMQADLARGEPQAGADRAQVDFLRAEAARAESRLASAELRSPIAGVVATPALESEAGEHLSAGDTFAKVLDVSRVVVDVEVPQRDVALVQPGQHVAIKLDSYPRRTWKGEVGVVSPAPRMTGGDRTFAALVPLPNHAAILRAGMSGEGKIYLGLRPAGYVLLRKPALWVWQMLWNWIGW